MQLTEFIEWALYPGHLPFAVATTACADMGLGAAQRRGGLTKSSSTMVSFLHWKFWFQFQNRNPSADYLRIYQVIKRMQEFSMIQYDSPSPHHANYFLQLLFIIYLCIYFPSMGPDFLFVFLVNLFFSSTDSQQKCQGLAVLLLFWGCMKQSVAFRGRLLFSSPGPAFTSSCDLGAGIRVNWVGPSPWLQNLRKFPRNQQSWYLQVSKFTENPW